MKKTIQPKKLALSTETLRLLCDRELERAVGGLAATSICNAACAVDSARCTIGGNQ
jgi:hypothetical protein